jgi:predicted acetyltransferase
MFEGEQLVAAMNLQKFERFFSGERVSVHDLSGVGCLPLARGKGYMHALIQRGLEWMHDEGRSLCALTAFHAGYYRPMGFEWVGSSRIYTLPLEHLPRGLDVSRVRVAGPEDAPALRDVYEAEMARYRGPYVRPIDWWVKRMESTSGRAHYFYLYEDPLPRGYLYLQLGLRQGTARLHQLIWQTPEAYRALLGVLQRHKSQTARVRWSAPPDDPLWYFATHWDVKVEWQPRLSIRVVDLPAALALLHPEEALTGECTLQLDDPLASWNTGTWQIKVEGGRATAERTSRSAQVGCDIGTLSQLFLGDPDAEALRRMGRLAVSEEKGYTLLRALCPPARVWEDDVWVDDP